MQKIIEKLWFRPYTPIGFFLLLVFLIAYFGYPAFQKVIQKDKTVYTTQITPTPQVLGDDASIIKAIAKLIRLPSDEKPKLITITDIEQFRDQPFFRNAKNADVLVLFEKNKLAILYDPKENIVLNTAPIAQPSEIVQEPTPTDSPSTPTPKPTLDKTPTPTSVSN